MSSRHFFTFTSSNLDTYRSDIRQEWDNIQNLQNCLNKITYEKILLFVVLTDKKVSLFGIFLQGSHGDDVGS